MNNAISISNEEILRYAKDKVSQNWGMVIVASILVGLMSLVAGQINLRGVPLGSLVLTGPITLGYAIWALNVLRNDEFEIERILDGFKNFGNSLATYLLMVLLVILWSLLLIIPGIIKALAYSQALFILADEPDIAPMEALRKSEAMMKGNKTKYFLLGLIFLLLSILCVFTLGIGFFFLLPLIQVTLAKFYQEVRVQFTGVDDISEIESLGTE